jgi:hypothetical protein
MGRRKPKRLKTGDKPDEEAVIVKVRVKVQSEDNKEEESSDANEEEEEQQAAQPAVCGILGSGEQTRIESCIIRIPESMVESQHCLPN